MTMPALLATRTRTISKMMATQTMISAIGILAKLRDRVRVSPRAMELPLAAEAAVVGVLGAGVARGGRYFFCATNNSASVPSALGRSCPTRKTGTRTGPASLLARSPKSAAVASPAAATAPGDDDARVTAAIFWFKIMK